MDEGQSPDVRADGLAKFEEWCQKLRDLAIKADELGFKIWVNVNGKTGHTYSKDYKPTDDADNDYESYQQIMEAQRSIIKNLIFPPEEDMN